MYFHPARNFVCFLLQSRVKTKAPNKMSGLGCSISKVYRMLKITQDGQNPNWVDYCLYLQTYSLLHVLCFRFCTSCLLHLGTVTGPDCAVCRSRLDFRQNLPDHELEQKIKKSYGRCEGCQKQVLMFSGVWLVLKLLKIFCFMYCSVS